MAEFSPDRRSNGDSADDLDFRNHAAEALIIDPSSDQRQLLRFVLSAGGFVVKSAKSGEAGIRLAEDAQPDVIITELTLPAIDGFEVLRRIRDTAATRTIPVVVWTATAGQATTRRANDQGAAAVLIKPCAPDLLLDVTRRVVRAAGPAVRQQRRLRRTLVSLRRIAAYYGAEPQARDRLARLVDRLQQAILMFDDDGHVLAAGALTEAVRLASRGLVHRCATHQEPATDLDPFDVDDSSGSYRAMCVRSGVPGIQFAAILAA